MKRFGMPPSYNAPAGFRIKSITPCYIFSKLWHKLSFATGYAFSLTKDAGQSARGDAFMQRNHCTRIIGNIGLTVVPHRFVPAEDIVLLPGQTCDIAILAS
jgi:hypothetical protein